MHILMSSLGKGMLLVLLLVDFGPGFVRSELIHEYGDASFNFLIKI